MQAVILAAGRGRRMGDLTNRSPKPMLRINGRPIIEYTLRQLPSEISEVVFILGHQGHKIINYFGDQYQDRLVRYFWQIRLDGSAGAIFQARRILKNNFLVLNGDDLYHRDDLKKIVQHNLAILVSPKPGIDSAASVEVSEQGYLLGFRPIELSPFPLTNTGAYVLDYHFFSQPLAAISEREFGLPQTLAQMATNHKIAVEITDRWHANNAPDDLIAAEEFIKENALDY
ncbi:MAG: sugar phosphate nucleotidyltransferase [Patescibacteria group bacterium]